MRVLIILSLFIAYACTNKSVGPEIALKEYVEGRMGKVIDREFVISRSTGRMLESLSKMSEAEFKQFADLSHIKPDGFKVLTKACEGKKCMLTYTVGYVTQSNNKPTSTSEVKNAAEMIEVDNKWLIADVSNIKTSHENLEPINPLQ